MARDRARPEPRERKFTVTVASPSQCRRVLSIEIPAEELEREKVLVRTELQRDLRVPGFRKGKVPVKYVEKNYAEVIHNDAVRNLLPHVYDDALVREGIAPVGEPKFENVKAKEGEPITFDVEVEVRPQVEIKDYRGIKVKIEKAKIDDARVDEALRQLQDRLTTLKVVDRPVREDDFLLIDYGPLLESGEIDRKAFAQNYPVDLSSEALLPEFREGLVRMETGEEKEIFVAYPDNFQDKDMAGTSRTFSVRVKEIKEKVVPELDDEFARRLGDKYADLAALKAKILEDLEAEEEKRSWHEAEERVIDRLIEKNPFEVPRAMVENYLSSILEEDRRRRPDVVDEEEREREVREHFADAAVRTIKKYFVLEAIKRQENIELKDEEVDAKIEELSQRDPGEADQIKAYFRHPDRRRSLAEDLLDKKALAFLMENAEIKAA